MDYLARREHSFFELLQKLTRRFPEEAESRLRMIIQQLADEGLQSDLRFVESYVYFRRQRGFGPAHIRSSLRTRGVTDSLVNQVLFEDDDAWLHGAKALVAARLPHEQTALLFGSREHQKLHRLLQSRGFSSATIRQVLDPLLEHV